MLNVLSYYHSSRLHWNSIERVRGTLEDNLLDDVVEWCMWHYPNGKCRPFVSETSTEELCSATVSALNIQCFIFTLLRIDLVNHFWSHLPQCVRYPRRFQ